MLSALFLYLMCIILLLLLSRTFVKCRLAISALAVFVFFGTETLILIQQIIFNSYPHLFEIHFDDILHILS